jgi:hypothetical protein
MVHVVDTTISSDIVKLRENLILSNLWQFTPIRPLFAFLMFDLARLQAVGLSLLQDLCFAFLGGLW